MQRDSLLDPPDSALTQPVYGPEPEPSEVESMPNRLAAASRLTS